MRVVVLGVGRVGSAMVMDLARGGGFEITAVDAHAQAVERVAGVGGVRTVTADLRDPARVRDIAAEHDLVVGAVPGSMGLATVRAAIEARRPVVDISFFPEDAFVLDEAARSADVPVFVDCGVAPGCSNLIFGRLRAQFAPLERFACYVGGLPVERRWPWEYKAPFSPADVLEEYTRPARFVAHGGVVTVPALGDVEPVEVAGLGTIEAFVTDGLRTLLRCTDVGEMVEKTMRYPGHAELMRVLREAGFLATTPVRVGGVNVAPRDLTSQLLFPAWELAPGEEDITVMRVVGEGTHAGRRQVVTFDLFDRYDRASGTTSMARTTGYTCTAVVRMLAAGLFRGSGVIPLEVVGSDERAYGFIMRELAARGIVFTESWRDAEGAGPS